MKLIYFPKMSTCHSILSPYS